MRLFETIPGKLLLIPLASAAVLGLVELADVSNPEMTACCTIDSKIQPPPPPAPPPCAHDCRTAAPA